MAIKLFASDLDGTLLKADGSISDIDKKALKRLEECGIIVAFVTGRVYTSPAFLAKGIDLKLPIVGGNGAVVVSDKGEIISKRCIHDETVSIIADYCDRRGHYYHFYDDDTFYSKVLSVKRLRHIMNEVDGVIKFQTSVVISDRCVEKALARGHGITKISIGTKSSAGMLEVRNSLRSLSDIEITSSTVNTVEVMTRGVNKYTGLLTLLSHYGIDISESAAIGDYENDIPMIEAAGIGIAMGNADPGVKGTADFITLDNESDGVAYAVNKYILGE